MLPIIYFLKYLVKTGFEPTPSVVECDLNAAP